MNLLTTMKNFLKINFCVSKKHDKKLTLMKIEKYNPVVQVSLRIFLCSLRFNKVFKLLCLEVKEVFSFLSVLYKRMS